jgi:hypothetical protein
MRKKNKNFACCCCKVLSIKKTMDRNYEKKREEEAEDRRNDVYDDYGNEFNFDF